jgi:hypothetical protein
MEGQCFIKLKSADKEKLKALPPVEHEDLDPDDGAVATIVEDSDEEDAPASVFVAATASAVAPKVVEPVKVEEKAVEKKKIIRKKTEA